jgi:phenylacetate-coenzyme A ligase PaaK-like adenylate-forming protein
LIDLRHPGEEDRHLRLAKHRCQSLTRTLKRVAANSPAYRRMAPLLLEAAAITTAGPPVSDSDQWPDWEEVVQKALARLPFTTEEALANSPESYLAASHDEVEGIITVPTSGSRGQAKRIYSTFGDLESTIEFFRFGMLNLLDPDQDERVALLMSGTRPGSVGDLLTRALSYWGMKIYVPGFVPANDVEEFAAKLMDFRPTSLVGLPSQIVFLTRTIKNLTGIKTVLLSGESAPHSLKNAIAQGLEAKVFVHYGLTEFGLGGAVECPWRNHPHLREADLIAEIIGPDGRQLSSGKSGELVLTSLSRQAMPLIRYRTGDWASLSDIPCACGSVMRTISVTGRLADRLELGDRVLTLSDLGEALYRLPEIASFRPIIRQNSNRPFLEVRVGLVGKPASLPQTSLLGLGKNNIGLQRKNGPGQPQGPDWPAEFLAPIEEALNQLLKGQLPFQVLAETQTTVPAAGGAKPGLVREESTS